MQHRRQMLGMTSLGGAKMTCRSGFLCLLGFFLWASVSPGQSYPGQGHSVLNSPSPGLGSSSVSTAEDVGSMSGSTYYEPTSYEMDLESRLQDLQNQIDGLQMPQSKVRTGNCVEDKLYAGAAAVFAKPHLKEAFQYTQINGATGQQTLVPFEYDYEASTRGWVGYRSSNGTGVRADFWGFDADGRTSSNTADGINVYGAHAVNVIFPANIFAQNPGETLVNSDSLKTEIYSYYFTYDTCVQGINVSGGLGLRHARLRQSLSSVVLDGTGNPIRNLDWERRFNGVGPAVSFDAKRRIGCSRLSFVTQGAGSFLFGEKDLERRVIGDQSPQPAVPFLALNGSDEVVGIGELGFGVEWCHRCRRGQQISIRGLYEGQLWAEAGAPTLGFLGFEGFAIMAGVSL